MHICSCVPFSARELATAWRMARCTFAGADPPHFRQTTSGATSARRSKTVLEQHSHRECQSTRLAAPFTACREAGAHEASGGGRSQRRPSGPLSRPYCRVALLGGERVSGIRPRAERRAVVGRWCLLVRGLSGEGDARSDVSLGFSLRIWMPVEP